MDFEKVCMMFAMQEPFYGILLSSMMRVPDAKATDTMGVGYSGNVFKLYYNPEFTEKLSVNTALAVLRHETLHLALNHLSIFEGKPQNEAEQYKRNVACDLEVNCYIDKSLLYNSEVKGLFVDDFKFKPELGAREYYKLLPENNREEQKQNPNGPGTGGKGNQFDDHNLWPAEISQAEKDMIEQAVEDMIVQAAEITEKNCGTIPGEMKIRIDAIRNRKIKPAADWKRYVRRYLGNEFSELIRKSKKRESRRFPDAAGNRHQRKSHVLVAIDTSGSVSKREYEEFMGQIHTLRQKMTFTIVECDTRITKQFEYTGKMPNTVFGDGGTSFEPPISLFLENRRKYDALIYFTDGYAPVPDNTPKDTLWVISSNGNKDDKKEFRKNGASVVYIPPMKDAS